MGATLVGRVLDADGRGVLGARVGSTARMGESYTPVYTDGDGRYRIDGLPTGPREVRASTSAGQRARGKVTIEPGENVFDLTFEESAFTVSGQAMAMDGEGVPGVRLQLVKHEELPGPTGQVESRYWNPLSITTSRADGFFVFETVSDGAYRIRAIGPGLTNAEDAELEVRGSDVSGLLVRVMPGAVLAGHILGLSPQDLSELRLTASLRSGDQHREGQVSPDGSYRFTDLGPGEWFVSAFLLRQGRRVSDTVILGQGQSEAQLDLEFEAGFALTGQLVAAGEPQVGRRLHLRQLSSPHRGQAEEPNQVPIYIRQASATTDSGGRFRFAGVESGAYEILAEVAGLLQPLEDVELTTDLDLVLELPAGRLSVLVRDSAGQGLAEVRLQAERLDAEVGQGFARGVTVGRGAAFGREAQSRTDADGVFVTDGVAPGRYRITAHKEGYAPEWAEVDLTSGFEEAELVLRPTPGLELELVDVAENPGRHVVAAFVDPSGRGVAGGFYSIDADDRVRITNAPLGSWELVVKTMGAAARVPIEVPSPGPVRIVLPSSGVLRLELPIEASGVAGATMTLLDAEGRAYLEPTPDGRATASRPLFGAPIVDRQVPAGSWTVRVTAGESIWEKVAEVVPGAVTRVDWK